MFDSADYELDWPSAALIREAVAFARAGDGSSSWRSDAEDLLHEAFAGPVPLEDFRAVARVADESTGGTTSMYTPSPASVQAQEGFLTELATAAASWSGRRPKPLWSERHGSAVPAPAMPDHDRFTIDFVDLVEDLRGRGYFEEVFPSPCPKRPEEPVYRRPPPRGLEWLDDFWPLTRSTLLGSGSADPDEAFDLVEALHDVVSRPRERSLHAAFLRSPWPAHNHYSLFSAETGRLVYRAAVNDLLDGADIPLQLAGSGEDVGRLVRRVDDAREDLAGRSLATPEPETAAAVAHALALFRARHADVEEKRSAIAALARVLEGRRTLLKQKLRSKDEGALFHIANEFDLRHRRLDQQGDYDPVFLDWIFWWYLATVELTDRLIARQELS